MRCPGCGIDAVEFPDMAHAIEDCPGPECTCYEFIGGHQMGCPLYPRCFMGGVLGEVYGL